MKRTAFFLSIAFVLATGSAFVTNSKSNLNANIYYFNSISNTCQGPVTTSETCDINSGTPCTYQGYQAYQSINGSECQSPLFFH